MALTWLAISGSLLCWSLRSWVTFSAVGGDPLVGDGGQQGLRPGGALGQELDGPGLQRGRQARERLEDDRRHLGVVELAERVEDLAPELGRARGIVLGEDARDERTDRARAARGPEDASSRLRSFSVARSSDRRGGPGDLPRLLQARPDRRSKPAGSSNLGARRFIAASGPARRAPGSSSRAQGLLQLRRQAPLAESLGQHVERLRAIASSSRTSGARSPSDELGVGLRTGQEPLDQRAAASGLSPGRPAPRVCSQPPGDLGLRRSSRGCRFCQTICGIKGSRSLSSCTSSSTASGSMPAELPRRDGDLEPDVGLGIASELDDPLADRRLDLPHVPRRADAPGAERRDPR